MLKNKLTGYEINEKFDNESIFKSINKSEDINILMGSRSFYEGWDSNRPNVINMINIGKKVDLPMQMNSRELLIKELLNKSHDAGTLSQVIVLLNKIIDERIGEYHRLSIDYPGALEPLAKLAQKANGTKNLLAREGRGNPYE